MIIAIYFIISSFVPKRTGTILIAAKLEQQLESYKKKCEEIPDLRAQVKTMESQIDSYVIEKVRVYCI